VTSPDHRAPARVRPRILSAALRCFLDHGYERTTIAQIRRDSGVSNGALFHHFPTKESIADELYVEGIASFQEGVRELVQQPPRSLLAATRAVIGHQLTWTEQHADLARFIYQRGHPDFDSPGGAAVGALNRSLAAEVRQWLAPLAERGLIRPVPMLVVAAVVNGPAHAVARRWLAGQVPEPLTSYTDVLARTACAALSADGTAGDDAFGKTGDPVAAEDPVVAEDPAAAGDLAAGDLAAGVPVLAASARLGAGPPDGVAGRVTVELLDADGLVTGRGEATIRLAPG
jgi:AcrR family transcriptional regulator